MSDIYVPNFTPTLPSDSLNLQTWFFSFAKRELRNSSTRIQLTGIESLLIKTLTLGTERICSKHELISGIGKDPHVYRGLEMCLSRLQNKFRYAFNERLFRSVRNRGYCLVQDVKIADS
ncbi:winged helix-turn-helix domain-containing protein [Pseudomonas sp. SIMBA_077]